ncbi:MAG TPA: phage holin family protein [Opitutaceae bacterium]|nr:phage holin family protein [Opitutaceae bacterium]
MHRSGLNLVVRWLILAAGVALSTWLVPGIRCDSGVTLVVVVLLLSLFNAILKPLLVVFTLPFVVLSLGLGVWLINAFLFLLVGRLVEGFHVRDFWSALWGALIISVTNIVLSGMFRTRVVVHRPPPPPNDVIDI